ncbi:DUF4136 domain-containing protein [uncultured Dokdonia sp.]|uniref:DUF4136 domain-containing protein n=1 Tax=uncultured Dokdonia sp. TaxID=575653 RepID=UPI002618FAE9|nr:DUF4136 domain-containing protein [uncultured Dokdonia sp.]
MRVLFLIGIASFLISCGSTFVDYDYDEKASFESYKTYQYDFREPTGLSEFDERRFIKFTDSVLESKGYTRTDYNSLSILIQASEYETASRNTVGVGLGGGGGNVGVGISGGIPIGGREQHQQITLEFYDMDHGGTLVWQAISESDVKVKSTPNQRDAYFKKLVEKIFKQYPPKS